MKYFSIYNADPKTNGGTPTPEAQKRMEAFVGEALQRGEFVSGGGFLPLAHTGCVVRRTNGKSTVIDGPYTEAKEIVGGFAILSYSSRDAAIEGAKRFLEVAGDGECVTYQIADDSHQC